MPRVSEKQETNAVEHSKHSGEVKDEVKGQRAVGMKTVGACELG